MHDQELTSHNDCCNDRDQLCDFLIIACPLKYQPWKLEWNGRVSSFHVLKHVCLFLDENIDIFTEKTS